MNVYVQHQIFIFFNPRIGSMALIDHQSSPFLTAIFGSLQLVLPMSSMIGFINSVLGLTLLAFSSIIVVIYSLFFIMCPIHFPIFSDYFPYFFPFVHSLVFLFNFNFFCPGDFQYSSPPSNFKCFDPFSFLYKHRPCFCHKGCYTSYKTLYKSFSRL